MILQDLALSLPGAPLHYLFNYCNRQLIKQPNWTEYPQESTSYVLFLRGSLPLSSCALVSPVSMSCLLAVSIASSVAL